jgi:DNA-binding beta-propeller fold protein YncE
VLSTVSALFLSVSTPATHAQTLYATLSTGNGSYPQTAAFDNSRNLLYVVLNGSNAIDVISTTSGAVLKTINLAYNSNPQGIAVSPITGLVYVSDTSTNNVAIINPSASYSVSTVAGGTNPLAISVNAYNGKVYTVNQRGTVTVIDPSKSNAITTINTGLTNLNALAINQTTGAVYVTDLGAIGCGCNGSLVTINPTSNAFTKTSTGASPGSIAIDPTTGNVFVGNLGSNNV